MPSASLERETGARHGHEWMTSSGLQGICRTAARFAGAGLANGTAAVCHTRASCKCQQRFLLTCGRAGGAKLRPSRVAIAGDARRTQTDTSTVWHMDLHQHLQLSSSSSSSAMCHRHSESVLGLPKLTRVSSKGGVRARLATTVAAYGYHTPLTAAGEIPTER